MNILTHITIVCFIFSYMLLHKLCGCFYKQQYTYIYIFENFKQATRYIFGIIFGHSIIVLLL